MKKPVSTIPLEQLSSVVRAPAHTPERGAAQVIGQTLANIKAAQERQEWADNLPHNAIRSRYAENSVLGTIADIGQIVNDET